MMGIMKKDDAPGLFSALADRPLADRLRPSALEDIMGQDQSHHLKTDSALSRSKSVRKEDDLFTGAPLPAGNTMPRPSTHPERNTQAAVFCTAAWTSV